MAAINIRGGAFYYRESGGGAPLLLIHGAAGNADVWSPIFDILARDYRVIAYDRRAHSRTRAEPPAPAENYSVHADDAAALLQALSAAPATVVGWSGGGLVALHLASKFPELVAGLILEEPPFLLVPNMTPDTAAAFRRIEELASSGRLRDAAETFLRFAGSYRTGGTVFDRLDPALRESMLANAATLLPELQAGTGEELTAGELERVRCPVTCLLGELTPSAIADGTGRLARVLPQARVVRIAEAAHAVHIDQPDRFVKAIRRAANAALVGG